MAKFSNFWKRSGRSQEGHGRPGLDLWHILVLGIVRLALDCDYDRWSIWPITWFVRQILA